MWDQSPDIRIFEAVIAKFHCLSVCWRSPTPAPKAGIKVWISIAYLAGYSFCRRYLGCSGKGDQTVGKWITMHADIGSAAFVKVVFVFCVVARVQIRT